jgi:hypothetical protein
MRGNLTRRLAALETKASAPVRYVFDDWKEAIEDLERDLEAAGYKVIRLCWEGRDRDAGSSASAVEL